MHASPNNVLKITYTIYMFTKLESKKLIINNEIKLLHADRNAIN